MLLSEHTVVITRPGQLFIPAVVVHKLRPLAQWTQRLARNCRGDSPLWACFVTCDVERG
jgi:hypothetical protein